MIEGGTASNNVGVSGQALRFSQSRHRHRRVNNRFK